MTSPSPAATTGPIIQKDSRRLPGVSLLWDRPGAILDVAFPDDVAEKAVVLWEAAARTMLDAVGWKDEGTRARLFPGGANLVLSAPIDSLYPATEVNEWALAVANAELGGPPAALFELEAHRLRRAIETERKPRLLAMRQAARRHGVSFIWDDYVTSVGSGTGNRGLGQGARRAHGARHRLKREDDNSPTPDGRGHGCRSSGGYVLHRLGNHWR